MVDNDSHLSVVSDDAASTDDGGHDETPARTRQPSRPSPKLKLPTERLTLEKQVMALQTYVRASQRGAFGVGARQIAPRMDLSEDSAGLVNNFFVEAGFLTKAGKGLYKPVADVVDYEREASFGKAEAPRILSTLIRDKWYFTAIQHELEGGRAVPWDVLIGILAAEAGVGSEREPQLAMILEWLEYVGLIEQGDDANYRLGRNGGSGIPNEQPAANGAKTDEKTVTPEASDAKSQESTKDRGDAPQIGPPILAFKFEFALTADDLKKLSPAQIAATFEAVGKVIAIKAEAGID